MAVNTNVHYDEQLPCSVNSTTLLIIIINNNNDNSDKIAFQSKAEHTRSFIYLCAISPTWPYLIFPKVIFSNLAVSLRSVVLNLFRCWDPLNATDVIWDPQVKSDLKLETNSKYGE